MIPFLDLKWQGIVFILTTVTAAAAILRSKSRSDWIRLFLLLFQASRALGSKFRTPRFFFEGENPTNGLI